MSRNVTCVSEDICININPTKGHSYFQNAFLTELHRHDNGYILVDLHADEEGQVKRWRVGVYSHTIHRSFSSKNLHTNMGECSRNRKSRLSGRTLFTRVPRGWCRLRSTPLSKKLDFVSCSELPGFSRFPPLTLTCEKLDFVS